MPANHKLGLELSKVLFREEPTLLACDTEATIRAAFAVSNLLGCIMATVLQQNGNAAYLRTFELVMKTANDSAIETARKAQLITPNTTQQ